MPFSSKRQVAYRINTMSGSRLPVIRSYWRSPKNVKRENPGAWLSVSWHHWPVFMLHPIPDAKLFKPAWHFVW